MNELYVVIEINPASGMPERVAEDSVCPDLQEAEDVRDSLREHYRDNLHRPTRFWIARLDVVDEDDEVTT